MPFLDNLLDLMVPRSVIRPYKKKQQDRRLQAAADRFQKANGQLPPGFRPGREFSSEFASLSMNGAGRRGAPAAPVPQFGTEMRTPGNSRSRMVRKVQGQKDRKVGDRVGEVDLEEVQGTAGQSHRKEADHSVGGVADKADGKQSLELCNYEGPAGSASNHPNNLLTQSPGDVTQALNLC
ncbi:hypothetical protein PMIN03_001572 [Paraphaeosphaeria minitans]